MFRNLYPENIKLTMHWSDDQYETFCDLWEAIHATYIAELRKSYIYSEKFFDLLLSLFFISVQTLNIPEHIDKKAALLTILLFNVMYDDRILVQTDDSIEVLSELLTRFVNKKLISSLTKRTVISLLEAFKKRELETYSSDLISDSDVSFIRDLLISTNPVIVDNRHVMFYYDNPHESTFAVNKPYPKPDQFFDTMFSISRTIDSKFFRGLYMERLYRLMDTQAKKSIFPF